VKNLQKSPPSGGLKTGGDYGRIGGDRRVYPLNDLSETTNPIVMIVLLIGLVVAGVQMNSHKDHFINQPTLEQTK
jgi:hypothetical protein